MHKINVFYLSLKKETPNNDYWDYAFLNDFINGKWDCGLEFNKQELDHLKNTDKAIVIIPARHHADKTDEINKELKKIKHVVLFLMGDEEADFPVEEINHKSIHIWVQNPHPGKHDNYHKLGCGYTPASSKLSAEYIEKTTECFFSGQITHERRTEMWKYIPYDADKHRTRGFTQGMKPEIYLEHMRKAKTAPCPSGAVIPDSFRLFEALECMAIPVADEISSNGKINGYWNWLLGEVPFPLIHNWQDLEGYIRDVLNDWPNIMYKQTEWWLNYKREFSYKVKEQLNG